jgi:magnesium-transporting ATPase (P-type)
VFLQSVVINSSAILRPEVQGSKTEVAILEFLARCGVDYEPIRDNCNEVKKMPFNSSRKRMGVVMLLENNSHRLVEKGASEMILEACSHYHSFKDGV